MPAGHFDWAPRPDEEVFAETPVPAATAAAAAAAVEESSDDEDDGVPGEADDMPSPLRGADPENTEVLVRVRAGVWLGWVGVQMQQQRAAASQLLCGKFQR